MIQVAALLLAITPLATTRTAAQDAPAPAAQKAAPSLNVGDAAPEFKVTQWFKGDPVTIDDKGTFIVECWATWCGPCIAAFPHLSELAKAYEGKISVIGVNVWERKTPEQVQSFVDAQGDKMSYHVAADGEKIIEQKWLKAAGRNGIPCAFVVSKGKIAWIGHPNGLQQELLDSILDGSFDIAAFAKAKEVEEAAGKYFSQHVIPLLRKKDNAGAIEKLEEMKKEFPTEIKNIEGHIKRLKAQLGEQGAPQS